MQTRFLIVRHATCAHTGDALLERALDAPLDASGVRQAIALAEFLRDESPLRVESSPRRRTLQTARAIADVAHCDVRIAPALDECDFGRPVEQSLLELQRDRDWRGWNPDRDPSATPAGAEIRSVQRRIGRYLMLLAATCAGATLVLVTHAEIIRSLVLQCLGAPARDYLGIAVDPASITRVSVDARGARLESTNLRALPSRGRHAT